MMLDGIHFLSAVYNLTRIMSSIAIYQVFGMPAFSAFCSFWQ